MTLTNAQAEQVLAVPQGGICANGDLTPNEENVALVRTATVCLVNRERLAHGEKALLSDGRLARAAQGHSEEMAAADDFAHVGAAGDTPANRMRAVGYIYSSRIGYEVGENIAWGTLWLATPDAIVAAWMASPEHRANILDPHYVETGVGVCPHVPSSLGHGQAGAMYTQDFGVIIT